jgi:hypothetical protein
LLRGNTRILTRGPAQVPAPPILDTHSMASVLLEGEQNKILPCVGREQHAAPCTPHPFPFSLPPDTCTHGIVPGKGDAPVQRTTKPCLEALKLPSLCEDLSDEAGGVGFGPVHSAGKAGTETLECAVIEAIKLGGMSLDANTTPAPTKGTESEAWRGLEMLPLPPLQKDPGMLGMPLREAPNKGMRRCRLKAPLIPP